MLGTLLARWYRTRYRWTRFKRHLSIPSHWRVLDVGSGDSPFAPADVVCEKFPWDDTERTAAFTHDRPLVVGDIEALPFKDKSFDFIHCSHVLEHTFHPDKAIAELMRVGRRGYIEVPSSYHEKALKSLSAHLWFVNRENNTLIFTPKPKGLLDEEINATYEKYLLDVDPLYSAYHYANFYKLLTIGLEWDTTIHFRMEGTFKDSSEEFLKEFQKGDSQGTTITKKAAPKSSIIKSFKNAIRTRTSNKKKFELVDVLACPYCHASLSTENSTLRCVSCQKTFSSRNGIPILLP